MTMRKVAQRIPFTPSKTQAALWAVVTADGVNRTGCKHFDLHNPGQKEIANHRRGSSSLVTFHLDRDDSRPEHKTVGQSASVYLSVDEAKQIMQALQQVIKEADDERQGDAVRQEV